jgi:hypothetical protein
MMQDFLEQFPKLLAFSTFAILSIAVVHEWGYFVVVGWHFLALMTPLDYLTAALLWIPATVLIWGFMGLMAYQERVRREAAQLGLAPKLRWFERVTSFNVMFHLFGITFLFSAFVGFFLSTTHTSELAFAYCLALLYAWYFVCKYLVDPIMGNELGLLIHAVPNVVGLIFTMGVVHGYGDLRSKDPTVYLLRTEEDLDDRRFVVWRNLDKGILGKNLANDRIEFYKWADIKLFSAAAPSPDSRTPSCRYLGFLCNFSGPSEVRR